MPLLDKLRKLYGVGPVCSELILPRQRITTVSNSDIIRINAVPVRSAMLAEEEIQRVYDENHRLRCAKVWLSCYGKDQVAR
ncbi:putative transposase [Escherichia coli P0299917.7]|nr:putative transposase [Escherichia coli P0299917.7]